MLRDVPSFDGYSDNIKADGRLLKDENGEQYIIKGMTFGNNVWSNLSAAHPNKLNSELCNLLDYKLNSIEIS